MKDKNSTVYIIAFVAIVAIVALVMLVTVRIGSDASSQTGGAYRPVQPKIIWASITLSDNNGYVKFFDTNNNVYITSRGPFSKIGDSVMFRANGNDYVVVLTDNNPTKPIIKSMYMNQNNVWIAYATLDPQRGYVQFLDTKGQRFMTMRGKFNEIGDSLILTNNLIDYTVTLVNMNPEISIVPGANILSQ